MKILFSKYLLRKKLKLNSQEQSDICSDIFSDACSDVKSSMQTGALLKVIEGNNWGVADISPKTELGDNVLEVEIKNRGALYARAVELAQEDLQARKEKKSLLQNKPIKNNYLITDYKVANLNQSAYSQQTVKIKADRDIFALCQLLNSLQIDLKIRLDFNSILSEEQFETFLKLISPVAIQKIEYIEDPTLFNNKWKYWNQIVALAFDFQKTEYNSEFAKYRIIKPSRQGLDASVKNFTLTSAMEHPVGLAHGLRIAQQKATNDSGFLTLDLFEDVGFNQYFEQKENYLNFSAVALQESLREHGVGMSDALSKVAWVAA